MKYIILLLLTTKAWSNTSLQCANLAEPGYVGMLNDYISKSTGTAELNRFITDASKSKKNYESPQKFWEAAKKASESGGAVWKKFLEENQETYIKHFSHTNIDSKALKHALSFFSKNMSRLQQKNKILINDYTKPANQERSFFLDLTSGEFQEKFVSHGANSDVLEKVGKKKKKDGDVEVTSNKNNSKMTSSGFMVTSNLYRSDQGFPVFKAGDKKVNGLRLIGLEDGKNDNVFERGVVIHEKNRSEQCWDVKDPAKAPVTWGCPGFPKGEGRDLMIEMAAQDHDDIVSQNIDRLPADLRYGGTLIYNYTPQEAKDLGAGEVKLVDATKNSTKAQN